MFASFLPDLYTCRRYKPLSSLTDQVQDIRAKPRRQTFFNSGDMRTISRSLYQSNIGHIPDCSQWIDLKTSIEDNSGITGHQSSSSSSQNDGLNFSLESLKQQQRAARKYSDYLGQVSQSENSTQESIKKISHSSNRYRKTSLHTGYWRKHWNQNYWNSGEIFLILSIATGIIFWLFRNYGTSQIFFLLNTITPTTTATSKTIPKKRSEIGLNFFLNKFNY